MGGTYTKFIFRDTPEHRKDLKVLGHGSLENCQPLRMLFPSQVVSYALGQKQVITLHPLRVVTRGFGRLGSETRKKQGPRLKRIVRSSQQPLRGGCWALEET